MAAEPQIVTKTEFARLSNVTPGRVSQWISEGKIGPDCLVGTGRRARIDVAKARKNLKAWLDPVMARNERTGGTKLEPLVAEGVDPQSDAAPDPASYRARRDLPDDFTRGALYGMHATAYGVPTMIVDALRECGVSIESGRAIYAEQRGEYALFIVSAPLQDLGLISEDQEVSEHAPTQFSGFSTLGWSK